MYACNAHKMIKNCIWNISLYGSEIWTIVKNERVVNVFERWCWRRMLKITRTARIAYDKVFQSCERRKITFKNIKKWTSFMGRAYN
jgi:hypothetical protein